MTRNSFLRRNLLTLAAAAGMMSVVMSGIYLKNPETLIADSYNRVLGGSQDVVEARWPSKGATQWRSASTVYSGNLQFHDAVKLQTTDGIFLTTGGALPLAGGALPLAGSTLPLAGGAGTALPDPLSVGARITIEAMGVAPVTFEVLAILPLNDTITMVDTTIGSPRLMMVTARETSTGSPRVIRFPVATSATPTIIVPGHDADQTL